MQSLASRICALILGGALSAIQISQGFPPRKLGANAKTTLRGNEMMSRRKVSQTQRSRSDTQRVESLLKSSEPTSIVPAASARKLQLVQLRASASTALATCSDSLSKNTIGVATAFDSKYARFAGAWVTRMRQLGFTKLFMATLDEEAHYNMSTLFAHDASVCIIPWIMSYDPSARIPTLVGLVKFDMLAVLTRLGHECIISEADVFWFQDPLKELRTFEKTIGGTAAFLGERPGLNIGFLYAKPSKQAISFWEEIAENWTQILGNDLKEGATLLADQEWFNQQLVKQPGDLWGKLDSGTFPLHKPEPQGFRFVVCNRSVLIHLTAFEPEQKLEMMLTLYNGSLACADLQ